MLKIDGNYGTGGGQIIRTALALSTITQIPFEAHDIRKGKDDSGLKAQHLECIKVLEKLCNAKAEDAELGSKTLKFFPGKIKGQSLSIDIGTAGSISLLLQSLLLPCFFADKKVKLDITGGTCVKWAMPYEYFENVLVPHLRKFCTKIDVKLLRQGYFPKGGGKIEISIVPKFELGNKSFEEFSSELRRLNLQIEQLNQGNLVQIKGIAHASKDLQNAKVAEREAEVAKLLLSKLNCPVNITSSYADAYSTGTSITLWAIFSKNKEELDFSNPIIIGADALGERGKSSEDVGKEVARSLLKSIDSKAPIDPHLSDNLIPWLALFGGKIKVAEITNHCRTNIWVCEQFLGKIFEIDEKEKVIFTIF